MSTANRHCPRGSLVLATLLLGTFSGAAFAQTQPGALSVECGGPSLSNGYGPFDYTNPSHFREKLPIVEQLHFDTRVETLQGGINQTLAGADIDYTLRAFPNHHRALNSMANYHLQHPNTLRPPNANFSADCYFQRAMVFRPDDGVVRMVYGIFLSKSGDNTAAIRSLLDAQTLLPESAEINYNLGLLYAKIENYPAARKHAYKAYELGFPLPGLKNKLTRLNEWDGPLAAVDESQ